jgi:uncharacterized phage protein (TIGR02218 family)
MRQGNVGQIRRGRMAFVAEVRSMAHALGQTVGRTFQAACDAALGDARCGVNLEAAGYKGTGAVITLLRDRAFLASDLGGFADNLFSFGTVEWTSGPNAGRRTEIMIHEKAGSDVRITLLGAPVRAIAVGHAFTIRAGCDKRIATCTAKFANAVIPIALRPQGATKRLVVEGASTILQCANLPLFKSRQRRMGTGENHKFWRRFEGRRVMSINHQ